MPRINVSKVNCALGSDLGFGSFFELHQNMSELFEVNKTRSDQVSPKTCDVL